MRVCSISSRHKKTQLRYLGCGGGEDEDTIDVKQSIKCFARELKDASATGENWVAAVKNEVK